MKFERRMGARYASWIQNPISRFLYAEFGMGSLVSPSAHIVGRNRIRIGSRSQILGGAHLICSGMPPYILKRSGNISIGDNSIVRESAFLITYGGNIVIGNRTTINPFSCIQGNFGVVIGDDVMIASHVSIFSANHKFGSLLKPMRQQGEFGRGVRIMNDIWIGSHSVILDGVTINNGSVVAAGSVVTRDIPPNSVVAGVPARVVRVREMGQ